MGWTDEEGLAMKQLYMTGGAAEGDSDKQLGGGRRWVGTRVLEGTERALHILRQLPRHVPRVLLVVAHRHLEDVALGRGPEVPELHRGEARRRHAHEARVQQVLDLREHLGSHGKPQEKQ